MEFRNPLINPWDKIIVGILIGLALPFAIYGILLTIYDQLDSFNLLNGEGLAPNFRERTIALIAIFANAIAMQIFNRKNLVNAMRGIIFPTLLYVGLWMWIYGRDILGI